MTEDKKKGTKSQKNGAQNGGERSPRTSPSGNVVRVWRQDVDNPRKVAKPAIFRQPDASPSLPEPIQTETPGENKKVRKLWVKGTGLNKEKSAEPPPGYEKHKHISSYRIEELERMREERHKRKLARKRTSIKARQLPKLPPLARENEQPEPVKEEIKIEPISAVYTVGIGRMSLQKLLQKLVDAEVKVVIDLRSEEATLAPGFAKGRDLAIVMKEAAGIEYRREEVLVPRREIMFQYIRDKNWSRFLDSYRSQLAKQRAEKLLSRDQFAKNRVALIGEEKEPIHDQRLIAARYLSEKWTILRIENL